MSDKKMKGTSSETSSHHESNTSSNYSISPTLQTHTLTHSIPIQFINKKTNIWIHRVSYTLFQLPAKKHSTQSWCNVWLRLGKWRWSSEAEFTCIFGKIRSSMCVFWEVNVWSPLWAQGTRQSFLCPSLSSIFLWSAFLVTVFGCIIIITYMEDC